MKTSINYISIFILLFLNSCSKKGTTVTPNNPTTSTSKPYLPTGWKALAAYAGGESIAGVAVAIGTKVYSGLGYLGKLGYATTSNKWYEYDTEKDTWTEKAALPGKERANAVAFAINGKIFVGLGTNYDRVSKNEVFTDFYVYDPASNSWAKKADFPGKSRDQPAYFSIENKGYITTGNTDPSNPFSVVRDLWEYDVTSDKWTEKTGITQAGRCRALGFVINGKGYLGGGEDNNTTKLKDLLEYEPATDKWTVKNDLPVPISRARGIFANNQAFIVGGLTGAGDLPSDKIYQYNQAADSWSTLGDLPSEYDFEKGRFYSIAAITNQKIYFGAGGFGAGGAPDNKKDFYEFTNK